MDHRPFENWLLAEEPISSQQKHELQAHLQTCTSCTALAEVNLALKSVRSAEPAEGFTSRFQVHLAARRKAQHRRNILGFALLSVSVAGLLTWLAWPVLSILVHSPVNVLSSWLSSLTSIWAFVRTLFQAGTVFFKVIPNFIPLYVLPVLLFAAAGWSLLWIFSMIKLTKLPQGA